MVVSPSDLLGVIRSCLNVRDNHTTCLAAFFLNSCPLVLCVTGDPKFSEGLLRYCKQCLGKSSPCLIFLSSCDKDGLDVRSYLLFDIIYLGKHISSHSVDEERIKYI